MCQLFFWELDIAIFLLLGLTAVWLFYEVRARMLRKAVLQVLYEHYQQKLKQDLISIAEIAKDLEGKGKFPKYIPKLFGLYDPISLTTDACRKASKANLITKLGHCYKLPDAKRKALAEALGVL